MKPDERGRLLERIRELESRLEESEETLRALRSGEVDAIVVGGAEGERVYTLSGADESYRALVQNMPEGALTLARDGLVLFSNEQFACLAGLPLERVIGARMQDFVAPEDAGLLSALLTGDGGKAEVRLVRDGARVPAYLSASVLRLDKAECISLVITDLTEQKRNEEIVAAEKLARSILEQAAGAMLVVDPAGRIMRASRAAEQLTGTPVLLRHFDAVFPLREASGEKDFPFDEILSIIRQKGTIAGLQATAKMPDGRVLDLLVNVAPLASPGSAFLGCVIALSDVTGLKKAQEAVRESEQNYRLLFENSLDGILITTPAGRVVAANGAACRILGRTEEEIIREGRSGIVDNSDPRVQACLDERNRTGRFAGELVFKRKDGAGIPVELSSVVYTDRNGVVRSSIFFRDISARKRAEQALMESGMRERASAAEFEATMEAVPVAILIARDPECRHIVGSRTAYELVRLPQGSNMSVSAPEGERPASPRMVKDGRDVPADDLPLQKAARSGRPVLDFEFELVFEDGTRTSLLGNSVPLFDEAGCPRGAVAAFTDITEHKRSEERLRQSQKLESVGLLAGGIAHDFNNLLTSVIGNASMVLDEVEPDVAERIKGILSSAERAAHLTRQLLAYSGKGQFILKEIDISQAVNDIADLVQFSVPKSVELALRTQRRLPMVRMDPGQLQQVLMNLVINAGEAIGEGNQGRITVGTSVADVKEPFIDSLGDEIPAGRYICIEVEDTGSGIAEEVKSQIFDPFFSTKFTGRGLGLAAVAGIVRFQKGAITVESVPGRGSAFRVFLPLAESFIHKTEKDDGAAGRATILVVDDDPSVREFIGTVLHRKGYRALIAADGQDALAVCGRESGRIDAAVVDVVMPVMGAHDLLPALKARYPRARILLTSGYTESEARRLCAAHSRTAFIQKPYTAREIVRAVEDLLGAGAPA